MEPLQKLHWFGILTAFLPFLMFTSAQNINVMRENLSPVFYNPKKTNPLSNQMAQLQRIARQQVCTINFGEKRCYKFLIKNLKTTFPTAFPPTQQAKIILK